MMYLDGMYVGKIRFYVTQNACENPDNCACEEIREQLQAQFMGWTE